MCKILEEMCEEVYKETREETREEDKKNLVLRMLEKGKYSLEEIVDLSGLSPEEVQQLSV